MFYIMVFKDINLFTPVNKNNWTETRGHCTFQVSFFNHKNVTSNYMKLLFVIKTTTVEYWQFYVVQPLILKMKEKCKN